MYYRTEEKLKQFLIDFQDVFIEGLKEQTDTRNRLLASVESELRSEVDAQYKTIAKLTIAIEASMNTAASYTEIAEILEDIDLNSYLKLDKV